MIRLTPGLNHPYILIAPCQWSQRPLEAREFNISLESQYLNISNKSDEANDEEVVIAHCAVNETDDEWSVIHAKFESRGFKKSRNLVQI